MDDRDEKLRLQRERLEINRDRYSKAGDHSRAFDIQQQINRLPKPSASGNRPPNDPPVATAAPAGDDDRIKRLEDQVKTLQQAMQAFQSSLIQRHDPFAFVFPARATDDGATTWFEQTAQEDNTLDDFTDGRQSTIDGDDSNYIDSGDSFFLWEVPGIGKHRYVRIAGGGGVFIGLYDSNASDGGKYYVKPVTGNSTMTATSGTGGALTMPEGMTIAGSATVLFANLQEDGSTGHALSTGDYVWYVTRGVIVGGGDDGKTRAFGGVLKFGCP